LVAFFGAVDDGFAAPVARPYDFIEIFAGDQSVTRSMQFLGYHGRPFDLRIDPGHNLLTPKGFCTVLVAILRIRVGGVCWAAPPCSTWVWMSRSSTGRDRDVRGTVGNAYIRGQNALVERLVLLCHICVARCVYFIIEQPLSSIMFQYPAWQRFLDRHRSVLQVNLEKGAFGAGSKKPTMLVGTAPYLPALGRRMSALQRHELDARGAVLTTIVTEDEAGNRRAHGSQHLKATQSYPLAFGAAHANAFRAHERSLAAVGFRPASVGAPSSPAAPVAGIPPAPTASVGAPSSPAAPVAGIPPAPTVDSFNLPAEELADMWFLEDLVSGRPDFWADNAPAERRLRLRRAE
jgi:hypothetical protein